MKKKTRKNQAATETNIYTDIWYEECRRTRAVVVNIINRTFNE